MAQMMSCNCLAPADLPVLAIDKLHPVPATAWLQRRGLQKSFRRSLMLSHLRRFSRWGDLRSRCAFQSEFWMALRRNARI